MGGGPRARRRRCNGDKISKNGGARPFPLLTVATGKGMGQKELKASGTHKVVDKRVRECCFGLCVPMEFCEPYHCSIKVCGWKGEVGFRAWALGLLLIAE